MQPTVSVIMPVYNGERFLAQAIESVLNQTFTNFELIIIDDGSTDGSAEIIKSYCAKDDRILFITQKNSGVSTARNNGIAHARGQWLCFIDCDDVYCPMYIERMLNVSKLTGADYVCCNFKMGYSLDGFEHKSCSDDEIVIFENDSIKAFDYLCSRGVGTAPWLKQISVCVPRDYDIKFDHTMTFGEDLFFCWKACLVSEKIAYLPEQLYFYRITSNSAVSKMHPHLFESYDRAYTDMADFACKNGIIHSKMKESIAVSFVRRLPSILRMTASEKRGIIGTYKRIKYIVNSERLTEIFNNYSSAVESTLDSGEKKLFYCAKEKKVLCMTWYAYFNYFKMKLARTVKGR